MQRRLDELKLTGRLPSPTGVGMAILRLTQSEDFSTEELTHTIRSDPALSGRLLKLANSAEKTSIEPATSIADAVMRLGVRNVVNVVLGFSVVSANREGACRSFDYDSYWSRSLARAVSSQALATRLHKGGDPSSAFIAGLFSDLGALALASAHPDRYETFLAKRSGLTLELATELEEEYFGINHRAVAQALLEDWGLPALFNEAVANFDSPLLDLDQLEPSVSDLITMLRLADKITQPLISETITPKQWESLTHLQNRLGMEEEKFAAFIDYIAEQWSHWARDLQLPTPEPTTYETLSHKIQEPDEETEVTAPTMSVAAPEERAQDPSLRPLKILAVDDDAFSLGIIKLHLTKAGFEVLTAKNGDEALLIALRESPDLVVSDWMMPEMDGVQLTKALRQCDEGRSMHIILLTGQGEEDRILEAFDAGVNDYVTKPFKPRVLMARVRAAQQTIELRWMLEKEQAKMRRTMADLAVLNRKFHEASLTDPLTELPNRRHAMAALGEAWNHRETTGYPVSVIMMDIDHFKSVNDNFGHDVGDEVLKATAHAAAREIRRGELVCRIGGEEFLVICPNAPISAGAACAERIRKRIEANNITSGAFDGHVTVSLGIAQSTDEMTSLDDLLKAADEAVYEAKESGRNRAVIAQPVMQ